MDELAERPVRIVVTDDLERRRLTVFFRLILVIPVWIALAFWSIGALVVVVGAWFVLLARGRCSAGMHEFLVAYVRYATQVSAYLRLASDPYPGFAPKPDYPVRIEIDGPQRQRRLSVFFRLFLAIPAILFTGAVGGGMSFGGPSSGARFGGLGSASGASSVAAFLGWFAALARGRMPRGLRDLVVYGLGYSAQTTAYLLLLTDRYPSSDPRLAGPAELPRHPIRIDVRDDLRRPRLLVAFRLLLALPHLVWALLWTVAAFFAGLAAWLVAPFVARVPSVLHRFLAAYVRYVAHVHAFVYLAGGPFPGFVGREGSYPIDVVIGPPERQGRWSLVFRGFLAVPALLLALGYSGILGTAGLLGWWSALVRGRMPEGLRNVEASSIRYAAQTWGYALMLTPRYPYAAPALVGAPPPEPEPPLPDAFWPEPGA